MKKARYLLQREIKEKMMCRKCNRFGHFARECREEEDLCYKCNGTGHFAKNC